MRAPTRERILVIKLGALGDLVRAFGAMEAIRRHHAEAEVIGLTRRPYAELLMRSGLVDAVWTDVTPRPWQPGALLDLRRRLRGAGFARVYDLQNSDRSALYRRLMWPAPASLWNRQDRAWLEQRKRAGTRPRAFERFARQLAAAGLPEPPLPSLDRLAPDIGHLALPERYVLLVPGSAPTRPDKRWPAASYAILAAALAAEGVTPVLLGTADEAGATGAIAAAVPAARDLTGRTRIDELPALARGALGAVGNDTGPMHLIAMAGCPALVLFGPASSPANSSPYGPVVATLQRAPLAALPADEVKRAFDGISRGRSGPARDSRG